MSRFTSQYGQRVRVARANAEMTQTQLARTLGLSRASIANIEAGRQSQYAEGAAEMAAVLRVSAGWLLTGEDPAPVAPLISHLWLTSVVADLRAMAERIEGALMLAEVSGGVLSTPTTTEKDH